MSAHEWLDSLVGSRASGGCEDCNAIQSMSRDEFGIYVLSVEHDATCPTLASIERRKNL